MPKKKKSNAGNGISDMALSPTLTEESIPSEEIADGEISFDSYVAISGLRGMWKHRLQIEIKFKDVKKTREEWDKLLAKIKKTSLKYR